MSIKSLILASTLTLASHTAIANKPLPCPTTGPVVDIANVIQGDTRKKIEDRLRIVDTEKHHQVVLLTVDNIEEYGYNSIREMGLAYASKTGCRIGYAGSDTGVLMVFSKTPAPIEKQRYGIEVGKGVEGHLTDLQTTNHIGRMSGEKCGKDNTSCRLDIISDEIVKLINIEMAPKGAVENSNSQTQSYNEHKSSAENSQFWNMLGAGVVILIGTGGVGYAGYRGVHALRRGSRKKILKQEILDLSVRTNTEAQKYPDWFQQQSCRRAVNTANEMQHYTDEQLDEILDDSRERKDYDKTKYFIESAILEWAEDYNQITGRAIHMTDKYNKALVEINTLKSSFLKEGYILEEVDVPQFPISRNLTEVVSKAEHVVNILEYSIGKLKTVRGTYAMMAEIDKKILTNFSTKKSQYTTLTSKYKDIYKTSTGFDITETEKNVADYITRLREAYNTKNMPALANILQKGEFLLHRLSEAIRETNTAVRDYEEIASQIVSREKRLASVKMQDEYRENAIRYAKKTGRTSFSEYNLEKNIEVLNQILARISQSYQSKTGLAEVPRAFREFDNGYSRIEEYIGLDIATATIIANEAARTRYTAQSERNARTTPSHDNSRNRNPDPSPTPSNRSSDDDTSYRSSPSPKPTPEPSPSPSPSYDSGGGSSFGGGGGSFD